ncbi:hypothetical protein GCM10009430_07860 [Aquimarina litoralis]|uniref:Uncharacterized protein n=1 Tax=Aquimarina litoralis TaxID=584605 RepID=A0ABN1IIN2_9FLAO
MGRSLARNQEKGMITKASNRSIQITRLIYFRSISVQADILCFSNKAIIKNTMDEMAMEIADVLITLSLFFSLLKNLKKAVSIP